MWERAGGGGVVKVVGQCDDGGAGVSGWISVGVSINCKLALLLLLLLCLCGLRLCGVTHQIRQ